MARQAQSPSNLVERFWGGKKKQSSAGRGCTQGAKNSSRQTTKEVDHNPLKSIVEASKRTTPTRKRPNKPSWAPITAPSTKEKKEKGGINPSSMRTCTKGGEKEKSQEKLDRDQYSHKNCPEQTCHLRNPVLGKEEKKSDPTDSTKFKKKKGNQKKRVSSASWKKDDQGVTSAPGEIGKDREYDHLAFLTPQKKKGGRRG